MTKKNIEAVLQSADLEAIERVIYRNGDDIAVSVGRSFERLEERIDAAESRIYGQLSEIEDKLETELNNLRQLVEGALKSNPEK